MAETEPARAEPVPSAPRLTLIDASGFIFRAYHAIGHLSTSKGVPTNAVYGFTRMLLKALRDLNPTHVALAFDTQSRVGRQAIDPEYKANRGEAPPDLVPQFELIRRVVKAFDLPVLDAPGWEADDVIGTLARLAKAEGFQVEVVTGDKDFVQIVDEAVELFDPMTDRRTGPEQVRERLGIAPSQMRDYLALMGDAVDNVPKVPGIGPKTAAELIGQFGCVEALLERVDEVKKPKIREAIASHKESILRAKQLVTFKTDLELGVRIEDLARRAPRESELRALFSELEFYRLLEEMPQSGAEPSRSEVPVEVVSSEEGARALATAAREAGRVAVSPARAASGAGRPGDEVLIGLGWSLPDGRAFYVPFAHRTLGAANCPPRAVSDLLASVLASPEVVKEGHNLKSLMHLLERMPGAEALSLEGKLEDVELLSYLLNPSRREHRLVDLSRERLSLELPPSPEDGNGNGKKSKSSPEPTVDEAANAQGARASAVHALAVQLRPEVESLGLTKVADEIELPLLPVLARMERRGIRVDLEALSELRGRVDARARAEVEKIHELAGHPFNVGSNPQLSQVLYEELKLPILKKGKTGPSTDSEVLEKLAEQHPLPKALIEYRMLSKLQSTYLDTLGPLVGPDGRLHTTFHQAGTATGRLSSTDPNLQNIPIRTELGKEIRAAFVAEPGAVLVSADYSQIELRLLAHVAEDPGLIEAFERGEDVHTRTAAEVFGVPAEEVTQQMRRAAKAVNFGIAYGLSPHGLSTRLGISNEEAKGIIDRYFERYAGIRKWLDATVEKARAQGYVETLYGRRRWIGEVHSRNRAVAQAAERAAINMPIQGTAADLIKLAMLEVDRCLEREKLSARMILQVHDELLFEAPEAESDRVVALAKRCMSGVAQLRVPLDVEVGVGHSWAEAH